MNSVKERPSEVCILFFTLETGVGVLDRLGRYGISTIRKGYLSLPNIVPTLAILPTSAMKSRNEIFCSQS